MVVTGLEERIRLRDSAEFELLNGSMTISAFFHRFSFKLADDGVATAMSRLGTTNGPSELAPTTSELENLATEFGNETSVLGLGKLLGRLTLSGLVGRTISFAGEAQFSIIPDALPAISDSLECTPSTVVSLSRFVFLRVDKTKILLETPRSGWIIEIHDPTLMTVIGQLASPATVKEHLERVVPQEGDNQEIERRLLSALGRAGMLTNHASPTEASEESLDPSLRVWSAHDLLFHQRSRVGRSRQPFGGTYRFVGTEVPPPRYRRPVDDQPKIELPSSTDCGEVAENYFGLLNQRRSQREFDDGRPVSLGDLAELLWRTTRVRDVRETEYGEIVDRPFPSGGAVHELDTYIAVRTVDGLAPGLYRYDPVDHLLVLVHPESREFWTWFHSVPPWPEPSTQPQAVLVIASRFDRVMWKYEGMAYAVMLKNTGVLMQSWSLAVEALGLGGCPLGAGDSEGFARVAGLDPYVESSVAEFAIGRPDNRQPL
tara:strand:+ start:605 stop:2065 length:1461 start_codon:yes stop_codon:yes gene_type:complete